MEYLAHIDTEKERKQTIKEHLKGTAEQAGKFAEQFGNSDWGFCCGMLHDIGKYSENFQKRITGENNRQVDHSTAGAQLCLKKKGLYEILSYCIAGHHTGLPDSGGMSDRNGAPTLMGRMRKTIDDYQAYQREIKIPELKTVPFDARKAVNPDFSLSVFIRMIYSCLVDADFLDTEYFMKNGKIKRDSGKSMDVLLKRLESYISGWLSNNEINTINGRRTEILKYCLESGKNAKGLFRLTVPTGGGKTIASLAFALRHAVEHDMSRIIYVIPYTSIIEQNAEVFRKILGKENVLEHHSNVDFESSEELIPMQLASENWDKPVIVTTNVQFFESLFANKSSKCRKLHNICNSVIIFDEAQMLPNDYLKPCVSMIEELLDHYRTSIVLCTATQPALISFFKNKTQAIELCPRMEEQFAFFERVSFRNIGKIAEEQLVEQLAEEVQALCIVNTKKKAQHLYQSLKGRGVYHLSTTMYPNHRRRILNEIRERLKNQDKCILISTSLVEAGVDLDFQNVYRQVAGVDSIIQAGGRCNREGKCDKENSLVIIFQFEKKEYMPGQRQQMDITENILAEHWDISSLKTIDEYFKRLYTFKSESLDKKKIMDEFKNKKYNFAKVGKEFKLIEENTKTIFINREIEAERLLEKIKKFGYTKSEMRKAGQYCIQIYDKEFDHLQGAGMIQLVSEDIKDFYELIDAGAYTEEMGLNLAIDTGMAVLI